MNLFAYLDPGTGTFILQTVVAIGAGIAVVVKTFWRQIVGVFKPRKKSTDVSANARNTSNEASK